MMIITKRKDVWRKLKMLNIYTVFDKASSTHSQPYFAINDKVLIRDLKSLFYDKSVIFSRYPEDYELCHVGQFDERTGKIIGFEPIVVTSFIDIRDSIFRDSSDTEETKEDE